MGKRSTPEKVTGYDREVTRRVIAAREASGLLKKELAARIGLSESGYSPYENFHTAFTLGMLGAISRVLGRPIEWFLGLDSDLSPDEGQLLASYRAIGDDAARRLALAVVRDAAAEWKLD